LATSNGYIDNLLMTPSGDIAIVETKLFRNPQARRAVLAQVLDYATALFGMDYAGFEKAVLTASFAPRIGPISLYAALASPDQPVIVRPRTLARTETIKRYVYEIAPAGTVPTKPVVDRCESLSSEAYWEALEASVPGVKAPLEKLIDAVAELGVRPEYRASLNLRWDRPDADKSVNIGYISKNGTFWFDTVALYVPKSLALDYLNDVAAAFGAEVHQFPGSQNWTIYQHSKPLRIKHNLGQLAALASAIGKFIAAIKQHDRAQS
jgi:hypothetical protein